MQILLANSIAQVGLKIHEKKLADGSERGVNTRTLLSRNICRFLSLDFTITLF